MKNISFITNRPFMKLIRILCHMLSGVFFAMNVQRYTKGDPFQFKPNESISYHMGYVLGYNSYFILSFLLLILAWQINKRSKAARLQ